MAKSYKIKFIGNGDIDFKDQVCVISPLGGDYTLCGLTMDLDPITCGSYTSTNEAINCENCKNIIHFCRSLKVKI